MGRKQKLWLVLVSIVSAVAFFGLLVFSFFCGIYYWQLHSKDSDPPAQRQTASLPNALQSVHSIAFIGDSITASGRLPNGYFHLMQRVFAAAYPGIRLNNLGRDGDRFSERALKLDEDLAACKPDVVFLELGINDLLHDEDEPRFGKDAAEVIAKIKGSVSQVYVLSLPLTVECERKSLADIERKNGILSELAQRYKCKLVDATTPLNALVEAYRKETGCTDRFMTVDGVHLSRAGHLCLSNVLMTALKIPAELRKQAQLRKPLEDI